MIDYYHYSPNEVQNSLDGEPQLDQHPKHKRHRLLKWSLALLLLLTLIAGALIIGGYWYLQNASLDNTDGRTNILVLGVDDAAGLSDSIMIASIDKSNPTDPSVALLSVPRDLYVSVPGFHSAKINAAHSIGENNDYPGGGPALTAHTLEMHFDMPIHYFISLDFEGFETIVDAVGGVEIDVERAIDDPRYPDESGGYDPLHIPAGVQEMDGDLALRYARSRKSTNDFDRAYRQQQVALAVSDKLLNDPGFWRPRTIRGFMAVFRDNVKTDMSSMELLVLGNFSRTVELESTPQFVLDTTNLLMPVTNETGSALVPRSGDFGEIQLFVDQIFTQTDIDEFSRQF